MNIRSVTCFLTVNTSTMREDIRKAGRLAGEVRTALELGGFPVQTSRLATQPLSHLPDDPLPLADQLWVRCEDAGFEYLSLGPVLTDAPGVGPSAFQGETEELAWLEAIPQIIQTTSSVFVSVLVASRTNGLNLWAVRRTAWIIEQIARTTELGFGNLRLATLANVGPHTPFFPAAYHDGGPPALAIAMEAADLAVRVFSEASSLDEAQVRLIAAVEAASRQIIALVHPLTERHEVRFIGLDFSLAPFPEEARSIGAAIERLGVDRFGAPGTLFAASFLTDCLRRANYPHCGFNGLMLPVLEDAVLAARSQEGLFTINDLLLYSAVCGTGLDTVPLPGDIQVEELAGILLDVAMLALRLDKPLTARLMPIPGARAGDQTQFDFPYFANGRVLAVKGLGSRALFERGSWFAS